MVARGHSVVKEIRVWGMRGRPQEVRRLVHKVVDCGCDGMTIDWPDWVAK
jgi:glycerophosphoryl diester phosphodiesterase